VKEEIGAEMLTSPWYYIRRGGKKSLAEGDSEVTLKAKEGWERVDIMKAPFGKLDN